MHSSGGDEQKNGDLYFHSGVPLPKNIPGYIQNQHEPRIFHLILLDCKHRTEETRLTTCKKIKKFFYCHLLEQQVTKKICKDCEFRKE